MNTTDKNAAPIMNVNAETEIQPLTAEEVSNIDGGGIIDSAIELVRLLRTAGQPQV